VLCCLESWQSYGRAEVGPLDRPWHAPNGAVVGRCLPLLASTLGDNEEIEGKHVNCDLPRLVLQRPEDVTPLPRSRRPLLTKKVWMQSQSCGHRLLHAREARDFFVEQNKRCLGVTLRMTAMMTADVDDIDRAEGAMRGNQSLT